MSLYQLKNKKSGGVLKIRRMTMDVAAALNTELALNDTNLVWIKGISKAGEKSPARSLVCILRDLDTEGFNEHSANLIRRWYATNARKKAERVEEHKSNYAQFKAFMHKQNAADRKIVGKFLAAQAVETFEAGVAVGLSVSTIENYNYNENKKNQKKEET